MERRVDGEIRAYDAIQSSVGRAVVVQAALQGSTAGGALLARARAFVLLPRHPALPVVHDAGITPDGWVFVVRSRHSGQTLEQHIEAHGSLTTLSVYDMGADVASALEVLHAGGLVHGMVGPPMIRRREGGGWLLDEPLTPPPTFTPLRASEDVLDLASALEGAVGGLDSWDGPDEFTQVLLSALSPIAAERPSSGDVLRRLSELSARPGDELLSNAATAPRGATPPADVSASTRRRATAVVPRPRARRARLLVAGGVVAGLAVLTGAAIEFLSDDRGTPPTAPTAASSKPDTILGSSTVVASPSPSPAGRLAPYERKRRPGDLVWDGRYYWVSDPAKGTVRRTSLDRGTLDPVEAAACDAVAEAAGDAEVGAACEAEAAARASEVDTKEVRAGREPGALAVGDGVVWVANTRDGTVLGLDQNSLEEAARITVGGTPTGLAVSSSYLWVVDHAAGQLVRVDLRDPALIERVAVGRHPFEVAVARGIAWVTVGGEDRLARIDEASLAVTYVDVGRNPSGLVIAFGSVWVANHADGTWTQVDEKSASVVRSGASGRGPFAVSAGSPQRARGGKDDVVMIANDRSLNVRLLIVNRGRVVVSELVLPEPNVRTQQRRYMVAVDDVGACSITTEERRFAWTVGCMDNG